MKSEDVFEAMGALDDDIVKEVITKMNNTKKKAKIISFKSAVSLAAAFALVLALGVSAYAFDIFGFKALLLDDSREEARISLTQPQAVPEDLDAGISEKVANSRAAWAEWEAWLEENPAQTAYDELPEVFQVPDGSSYAVLINPDGSGTVRVMSPEDKDGDGLLDVTEERQVTIVEMEIFDEVMERYAKNSQGFESAYDFNYWSHSKASDEALKAIADKYGLKLRDAGKVVWSVEEAGMEGYFRELPETVDKVYWFNEGTFGLAYYAKLENGGTAHCYGYNSMYSTLSSGREVGDWTKDIDKFSERSYETADGTTVTILSNGPEAFLYVYLENSFFAMHIRGESELSETDINNIADNLNYSLMS